ncbi:MAG: hypothetical protein SGI97_00785 [candidate division Zixibacteria bacterium]|nr:hypothetical protein [candidate division Zixibacteria bacterium]
MRASVLSLFPVLLCLTVICLFCPQNGFAQQSDKTANFVDSLLSDAQNNSQSLQYSPVNTNAVDQIILDISPVQVEGRQFVTKARIVLLDAANNLITNYDLAANPITLSTPGGSLTPSVLSNPSLFNSGVIDFLPAGVIFRGNTGAVSITASNGSATSSVVIVSFNGYDVRKAFDFRGMPVTTIYSELSTTIDVEIQNRGNQTASINPDLKSFFLSGGGSVRIFVTPTANGIIDTVSILLPTENLTAGIETLALSLESRYTINGSAYSTIDTLYVPVMVLGQTVFTPVPGSFTPSSIYSGVPFDLGFDILTTGFSGTVDSTRLIVGLADTVGGVSLVTVYNGNPRNSSLSPNLIQYRGLISLVPEDILTLNRCYSVRLDFKLYSGGNIIPVSNTYPFTLCVQPLVSPTYVPGSFGPSVVGGGKASSFQFTLNLLGAPTLEIEPNTATFNLSGNGFSATIQLSIPNNQLVSGANVLKTESIFLPAERAGESFFVDAELKFRIPGSANYLTFVTDFNQQTVQVTEIPVVQVKQVNVLAPNVPKVNMGQLFQVRAVIENVSSVPTDTFTIRLVTDGQSIFDSTLTVPSIPPHATYELYFSVTGGGLSNPSEIFRVDVTSEGVDRLPPLDNLALVSVEEPAFLRLDPFLTGASGGKVDTGSQFTLDILLRNVGEADVSTGSFKLTTGGVDLGIPSPLSGSLQVGEKFTVALTAPGQDTLITLEFVLTDRPIDLNTGLPAQIADTSFSVALAVVSSDASLLASTALVNANVIAAGMSADLFQLTLTNNSPATLGAVRLEKIDLDFSDESGAFLPPGSLIEISQSGFYESDNLVTTASASGGVLSLEFDSLLIAVSETRTLIFRGLVENSKDAKFTIVVNRESLLAKYLGGPLQGMPIDVVSANGTSALLSQLYITTESSFSSSFVMRKNPFNPTLEPAAFRFIPPATGSVEFKIFTLLGEEVFGRSLSQNELIVSSGGSFTEVLWDGTNNSGRTVLNGVYVVTITHSQSGDQARIKAAVLK